MEHGNQQPRRRFTPEQMYEIIRDVERSPSIRDGLAKHHITSSLYYKWKRQLSVGIRTL